MLLISSIVEPQIGDGDSIVTIIDDIVVKPNSCKLKLSGQILSRQCRQQMNLAC